MHQVIEARPKNVQPSKGKVGGSKAGRSTFQWKSCAIGRACITNMQVSFERLSPNAADNRDFKGQREVAEKMHKFLLQNFPDFYALVAATCTPTKANRTRERVFVHKLCDRIHKGYSRTKDSKGRPLPRGDARRKARSGEHYDLNDEMRENKHGDIKWFKSLGWGDNNVVVVDK